MRRTYALPLATLTLGAGTGCAPALEGTWDMNSITFDGDRTYLPYTDTYSEDGNTYSTTYSGHLTAEDDGAAEIVLTYTYAYNGNGNTEATVYSGTWDSAGSVFTIEVENYDLECEIDGTDMKCEGETTRSNSVPVEIALSLRDAD